MDPRHYDFLRRNGLNMYNNYFNRDKKKTVVELPIEWIGSIPAQRIRSAGLSVDGAFINENSHIYDPFLYEYRDGDIAVPSPPETDKSLEEPSLSEYKNVPLDYIRQHGIMEFLLESEYPYSLECLFHYRKPCEYQKEYMRKLISEGRLTRKVFRL